ncbi:hypothetical protein LNP04_04265 [Chryseobacterium sp. C-71]|uniref:adenylate/guanylate cyclase domain-containing protein n=1 Tax=Chryseobacterium sp. C-71 TaxID=2893882 RepID=UPI001E6545DB|nr:adenylate/guanylate cyclase domain-containing protein [Chryseobacterium sp. C-71]UFH32941.1 hypothetical protein LNP04_04265 [Chryseobacterium sp. C-71]
MKNKFTSLAIICFLFYGNTVFIAQEAAVIVDLKSKLSKSKDEKEKNQLIRDIANEYIKAKTVDSILVYGKKSLPYLKKTNDFVRLGNVNLVLAQILTSNLTYKDSEFYLKEADKYYKAANNSDKKAVVNYYFGLLYSYEKKFAESTDYLQRNIQYYLDGKEINKENKYYIMLSYQSLVSSSFVRQNYGESYKYLNTYIDFIKKNYPEKIEYAHEMLAGFYLTTEDSKKALNVYKNLLPIYTKQKKYENLAYVNRNIGSSYYGLKKMDSAKIYLNEALRYYESKNDNEKMADINSILSHIYFDDKDYQKSEDLITKAIQLSPEKSDNNFNHKSYYSAVKVYNMFRDSAQIRKDVHKRAELENIITDLNKISLAAQNERWFVDPSVTITNYTTLSNAYELLGDYKKAHMYFQKAMTEKDKAYGNEKMKELSNLQSETEVANERAKVKLEEETKRIQLQKEIELKALRFEFEKKQAAAKTNEERKRLLLEEDLRRKEIQFKFDQKQQAVLLKYNQEKNITKINQEKKDAIAKAELESSQNQKNIWAVGAGLSLLLLGFAGFSYNQKRKDNKKIAEEKLKSDNLLLNILPHEVAEELKEKGKTNAKHFDEVSVLFTDFVNFTANSERIGVQEVLNELNICFTEFDSIMEKYNLEKIKTIGDAYLAVSGLPVSNDQHAKNAVNASLEILSYIQQRKKDNPNALDIRIGIHSGPIIAGIVGVKKFAYDIWGDTVNTAARMEQNSSSGKVNVSEATYQLIKDDFTFEHRGKIETKGKGAMEMYFVNQI